MAELLQNLAPYVPQNLLQEMVEDPSRLVDPTSSRFEAAVMFADISGFTPLTEALSEKGSEGAEELTRLLNRYFTRMIDLLENQGGDIVKFSGDALLVVFRAAGESLRHAARRALQGAEAIQEMVRKERVLATSIGEVELSLKVSIGAGEVRAMQVGGVFNRWEYAIGGDTIRQVALADKKAQKGEIVLSDEAQVWLHPEALEPEPLSDINWSKANKEELTNRIQQCIPGAILTWLEQGLRDWLAVLRPMSVIFVGLGGLDYEQPDAVNQLHSMFRAIQEVVYQYEGTINKLSIDDKGTVVLAMLGAPPLAHADDPLRAVRCTMDLLEVAREHSLRMGVGVATGRVFAGPVGSENRREYTVMGDTVNLAARLMQHAGNGNILCDHDTYRYARNHVSFEQLDPIKVKGKKEAVQIYKPVAVVDAQIQGFSQGMTEIVGREQELERLKKALKTLHAGASKVMVIEGEAGIGKTRLVQELIQMVDQQNVAHFSGVGESIERFTPYRVWRNIFTSFFELGQYSDQAARQERTRQFVQAVAPDQMQRIPLLNDILELQFPDSELTANLDPELRQQSLSLLVINLIRGLAAEKPVTIVVDDAHWVDNLSWELAVTIARSFAVTDAPVLLVLVSRPQYETSSSTLERHMNALKAIPTTETITLGHLAPEAIVEIVNSRLGLPGGELPEKVVELLHNRAGGNPFFAEEMVFTLRDNQVIKIEPVPERAGTPRPNRCIMQEDLSQALQLLPDTIQGLVLARIDRLQPERQLILKIGSVIGRSFAYPTLNYTVEAHTTIDEMDTRVHLDALNTLELTMIEAYEPELNYMFKHVATQEVSYESLLFSQRRQLHRTVASWYENTYSGNKGSASENSLATYFPLLTYHYHRSEDEDREQYYARLAGRQAAAQFANQEAVAYISRALDLTPDNLEERYDLLLMREKLHDIMGQRESQQADLAAMAAIAETLADDFRRSQVALLNANLAEATGNFQQASEAAQQAVVLSQNQGWENVQATGYLRWGVALWRLGNIDDARDKLNMALEQALPDTSIKADVLRNLGNLWAYKDAQTSSEYFSDALQLYQRAGDVRGESMTLNNLGIISRFLADYSQASSYYQQAQHLAETIGDRRAELKALSNLGLMNTIILGSFQEARRAYERALRIVNEIGDEYGKGITLVNLSLLYHNLGDDDKAVQHGDEALEVTRASGDRSTEAYAWTFKGHALVSLDDLDQAEQAFQQALDLRRDLDQPILATEPLAGLAYVALLQDDLPAAKAYTNEILSFLEENNLEGTEEPLRVYLRCYRVLHACGDPRAGDILNTMHQELQEKASRIPDSEQRSGFMNNLRVHRAIMKAWQAAQVQKD